MIKKEEKALSSFLLVCTYVTGYNVSIKIRCEISGAVLSFNRSSNFPHCLAGSNDIYNVYGIEHR